MVMFYRYGLRIFNLRNVQEIYIRDSLFRKKYILGFNFISNDGSFLRFGSQIEEIVFDDEHTMMKEFNKISKIVENKDQ